MIYLPENVFTDFGAVRMTSLDEIYAQSDIISLHLHHNAETEKMINAVAFEKMAAKAPIFINVSRGGLVDEDALIEALNSGKISAAGIDAITSEAPDINTHPLAKMGGNVILTPHAGYLSMEALHNQKITSSQFVKCFLEGQMDQVPVVNGIKRIPEEINDAATGSAVDSVKRYNHVNHERSTVYGAECDRRTLDRTGKCEVL